MNPSNDLKISVLFFEGHLILPIILDNPNWNSFEGSFFLSCWYTVLSRRRWSCEEKPGSIWFINGTPNLNHLCADNPVHGADSDLAIWVVAGGHATWHHLPSFFKFGSEDNVSYYSPDVTSKCHSTQMGSFNRYNVSRRTCRTSMEGSRWQAKLLPLNEVTRPSLQFNSEKQNEWDISKKICWKEGVSTATEPRQLVLFDFWLGLSPSWTTMITGIWGITLSLKL